MTSAPVLANLTPAATVLSPDRGRVVTFDREGRLLYYFCRGYTYKRSLGSEVHLRFRRQTRQRRQLQTAEAIEIFSEALTLARQIAPKVDTEVRNRLQKEILPWTPERLLAEADRFGHAYRPISILPPDQYLAVVLQATEGCTWNGCTFCNFYMDRTFRRCSEAEFLDHAQAVKKLLGRGLRLRRGIFLADGNALAMSNRRLDPLLDIAIESFPDRDIFGFVDLYSGDRRTVEEWAHLATRGLKRIYVGMETGLDELLEFVDKPGSAAELKRFVGTLKEAGVQVSLIVMVGLGGREYRDRHRQASQELLLNLPLDRNDLVYLSPFVEYRTGRYQRRRVEAGLTPMTETEVDSELDRLAARLRQGESRVGRYDIREFIY